MADTDPDDTLISQAMAGDRVSMEKLLLRCYDPLRSHVDQKLLGDLRQLVNADDIVQQTYAAAFAKITAFEPRSEKSFFNWLKTIASHQIVDFGRRRVLERRTHHHASAANIDGAESSVRLLLDEIAAEVTLPMTNAMWNELLRATQVALAGLPTDYQQVIHLHYLDGRPLEEVGRTMGRSTDAVRGICHRALRLLREELSRISNYV